MTPEKRAELAKLEDLAEAVSREFWQYIEKIARPIKGGARGQEAFLTLLAIRRYFADQIVETAIRESEDVFPVKRRPGRPPKVAA